MKIAPVCSKAYGPGTDPKLAANGAGPSGYGAHMLREAAPQGKTG